MRRGEWGVSSVDWTGDYAQVVSGGILGDGSLSLRTKSVTPTYVETHGYRQRDYVVWKREILGASMGDYTTFDGRTGKFYIHSTLWVTDPRNTGLYHSFYHNGRKAISAEVLERITDLGLTVFWLDDGSIKLHDGNGKFCTQGFSQAENHLIMSWLLGRYGINSAFTPEHEIFINSKELPKLLSAVYPIFRSYQIPSCMRYKMGVMAPENGQLIEDAKATRRSHDRSKYLRVMSNPVRKVRLRENFRMAQRRRMKNPEYRRRYNEYHKEWMRNKRHETPE